MLEAHAERLVKFADNLESGVGILDIVVRQFLALDLTCSSHGIGILFACAVELRGLVGILSVAESLHLVEVEEEFFRKTGLTAHIFRDVAVVKCGMGISLCRETETCFGESVAVGRDFLNHGGVVIRVAYHGDALAVLSCGAEHRGTAYVDVLDGVGESHSLFGHRRLERIEVDDHHVDQTYSVLCKLFHVILIVAASEQRAVHLGVKRLDASSADFRKPRHLADACHRESAIQQHPHRAAGGDDLPSHVVQGCGEFNHPSFIAYAY